MEQHTATPPNHCATCGVVLQGKFCHACGEKRLEPKHDFSIKHFLLETFESFAHFDSKLLRSFWLLFAKPGFLTAEFIAGRRVRYFKPIPMFIIAGILFYLFFGQATAFFSNLGDMNRAYTEHNWMANTFHVDTETAFSKKVAAAQREPEEFWKEMAAEAGHRSKTWLFLVVPVWGLILWLFFHRKINWLVPHLIFALHGFTFFVLFDLSLLLILNKGFGIKQLGDNYLAFLAFCFAVYNTLAIKRVYGMGRIASIIGGVGAMFMFLIVVMFYRQCITIWTVMNY